MRWADHILAAVSRFPILLVRSLPYLALFVAALIVGAELARPLRSASVAWDSQAAVLYFERIVSAHRLEAFVPTNPKPLLTVIFGALYHLTGDWRTLAWATLLAYATGVTLTAALATRVAGWIAGVIVGTLLMLNANLLFDVGYALAVPFALVGWAVAGLACSSRTPHYTIAGLALACATLARLETVALIGMIMLALAWATIAPRRWRVAAAPRAAWLVPGIALLALPVMLVHDQLLIGDPMYWASVAPRYAASGRAHVPSLREVVGGMASHYWAMGAVLLLGIVGFAAALRARRWWIAVAIVGLGPGVAALLFWLAFRGVIVPPRYVAPIDVALIFSAGIGAATIGEAAFARAGRSFGKRLGDSWRRRMDVAIVAGAAVLLAGPYWAVNPDLRAQVRDSLQVGIEADLVRGPMAAALATSGAADGGQPRVMVPGVVTIRLALDLGLSLQQVSGVDPSRIDIAGGYPPRGVIVFHSTAGDGDAPGWSELEIEAPRRVAGRELVPLATDPKAGYWVVAIR